MRGTNEKGHALLATRTWSSAVLAAQGRGSDVAAGEIDY
jgi:hypothetical protein